MRASLLSLLALGLSTVCADHQRHAVITHAPALAFAAARQAQTCDAAGETVCPDGNGCCPQGAPCTYRGITPICAQPCGAGDVTCGGGACCLAGHACPAAATGLCGPAGSGSGSGSGGGSGGGLGGGSGGGPVSPPNQGGVPSVTTPTFAGLSPMTAPATAAGNNPLATSTATTGTTSPTTTTTTSQIGALTAAPGSGNTPAQSPQSSRVGAGVVNAPDWGVDSIFMVGMTILLGWVPW